VGAEPRRQRRVRDVADGDQPLAPGGAQAGDHPADQRPVRYRQHRLGVRLPEGAEARAGAGGEHDRGHAGHAARRLRLMPS
jgi:hypothetical protein